MPHPSQVTDKENRDRGAPEGHKQIPTCLQQPAQEQPGRAQEAKEAEGKDESRITQHFCFLTHRIRTSVMLIFEYNKRYAAK